jgi:hypothetical protein
MYFAFGVPLRNNFVKIFYITIRPYVQHIKIYSCQILWQCSCERRLGYWPHRVCPPVCLFVCLSVRPHVCLHRTVRTSRDGFSWIFIFGIVNTFFDTFRSWLGRTNIIYGHFTRRPTPVFDNTLPCLMFVTEIKPKKKTFTIWPQQSDTLHWNLAVWCQYKKCDISVKKKNLCIAYGVERNGTTELLVSSKIFLQILDKLKSREHNTAVHQMCYELWTFPNVFLNGMFLAR